MTAVSRSHFEWQPAALFAPTRSLPSHSVSCIVQTRLKGSSKRITSKNGRQPDWYANKKESKQSVKTARAGDPLKGRT